MAALRPLVLAAVVLSTLALAAGAQGRPGHAPGPLVEVVVALDGAPLADSGQVRTLSVHGRTVRRLDLRARTSVSRLRTLASVQRSAESRLEAAVPDAEVRERYRI